MKGAATRWRESNRFPVAAVVVVVLSGMLLGTFASTMISTALRAAARRYSSSRAGQATIVVHGGAWAIPDGDISTASVLGVTRAADEAQAIMQAGGSAVDGATCFISAAVLTPACV